MTFLDILLCPWLSYFDYFLISVNCYDQSNEPTWTLFLSGGQLLRPLVLLWLIVWPCRTFIYRNTSAILLYCTFNDMKVWSIVLYYTFICFIKTSIVLYLTFFRVWQTPMSGSITPISLSIYHQQTKQIMDLLRI